MILMSASITIMPSTARASRFSGAAEVGLFLLGMALALGLVLGLITGALVYLHTRDSGHARRAGWRAGVSVLLVLGVAFALLLESL
jgi:hypothetical protein